VFLDFLYNVGLILRKYEQDMMKNVHRSLCKVRIYIVRFQRNLNFLY